MFKKVRIAEQNLIAAERDVEQDGSDETMLKLYRAQNNLQNQLVVEERLWKQKAHIK